MRLLDLYREGMGMKVIPIPTKFSLKSPPKYSVGLLKEIVEELIGLENCALEFNALALTNSNVSTLHTNAKQLGYKLHCFTTQGKKVLYVEKRGIPQGSTTNL